MCGYRVSYWLHGHRIVVCHCDNGQIHNKTIFSSTFNEFISHVHTYTSQVVQQYFMHINLNFWTQTNALHKTKLFTSVISCTMPVSTGCPENWEIRVSVSMRAQDLVRAPLIRRRSSQDRLVWSVDRYTRSIDRSSHCRGLDVAFYPASCLAGCLQRLHLSHLSVVKARVWQDQSAQATTVQSSSGFQTVRM